jgi:hypothetical protein
VDKALGFFRSFNFEKPALNEAVSRYGGDVMTLDAMELWGKYFLIAAPMTFHISGIYENS